MKNNKSFNLYSKEGLKHDVVLKDNRDSLFTCFNEHEYIEELKQKAQAIYDEFIEKNKKAICYCINCKIRFWNNEPIYLVENGKRACAECVTEFLMLGNVTMEGFLAWVVEGSLQHEEKQTKEEEGLPF